MPPKPLIELLHETEEATYHKELAAYEAAIKRGVPAMWLHKPEPPQSLVSKALRIQQQNNFRIGYDKYWHGKR